jgi:hypothetical protein
MHISGSFLDALAADIPAQNWGPKEWEAQFDVFVKMQMDTLVVIRCVTEWHAIYPSRHAKVPLVSPDDMLELYLSLADQRRLKVYVGTYDTGLHWRCNDWRSEIEEGLPYIDEIWERYGQHPSFYGWYMSHEGDQRHDMPRIWKPLISHIKKIGAAKPILISPRYAAEKYRGPSLSPPQHARYTEYLLGEMEGLINHAAYMDGHCHFKDLKAYVEPTAEVCARFKIDFWANVETFDRDMPWRFPPLEWVKLKYKMDTQAPYASKMITFEAPHFLSPCSMFPSARALYDRYGEYYLGWKVPARL